MTTTYTLNQGQERAAEGFFNFLFSKDSELVISGPGGVGKTFLMGHLIDTIMPRYHQTCKLLGISPIYNNVMMTATTNKAAEVLGKATGRPTKTIHSFLNLRVTEDYDTGISKLAKTPNWQVHTNQILFIDEASMIDSSLLKHIHEGTHQCKIIYVGDHCQLAPITETISPIYRRNLPFYELTEPMRNAEQPGLMAICNQLRQTVETKSFQPIHVISGVVDLLTADQMEQEVSAHFIDPTNQDRILAYTNHRVIQYNDHIRNLRGLPSILTVGERVINNSAISLNRMMMAVEDEFEVTKVASNPTSIVIDADASLEVLHCTLSGRHATFTNVPVPIDRGHFTALTKYYAKQKNWQKYYNLKNNYPDLRPRDAATVHKAQGSTYETVFIDMDDLSTCRNPAMAARLLYVGFTRAKRRVVMYGNLAKKFGGIVT
jgi:exodeoxyribonuclease V